MAYFAEGYYHALDRGAYAPVDMKTLQAREPKLYANAGQFPEGELPGEASRIEMRDIGISTPPFSDQLQGLKSRIFLGATRVELGFSGRGKGNMQGGQTTPEMYGMEERRDIRELAKYNKVQLSTHATFSAGSLAGFQENRVSDEARESALHEIERAIHFAADTTSGGPVVVHANEFPRPISEKWSKEGFTQFPGFPKLITKADVERHGDLYKAEDIGTYKAVDGE